MIIGSASDKSQISVLANAYFSNMVYAKADWDYKKFDVDEGLRMAAEKTSAALDATDPDLKDFANRGGKLIIYHGWNDPAISPLSTIDYYR
jgi:hypothetical protein